MDPFRLPFQLSCFLSLPPAICDVLPNIYESSVRPVKAILNSWFHKCCLSWNVFVLHLLVTLPPPPNSNSKLKHFKFSVKAENPWKRMFGCRPKQVSSKTKSPQTNQKRANPASSVNSPSGTDYYCSDTFGEKLDFKFGLLWFVRPY